MYGDKVIVIEPKWNLKTDISVIKLKQGSIVIEPKWNLKCKYLSTVPFVFHLIVIEPKWNLKLYLCI